MLSDAGLLSVVWTGIKVLLFATVTYVTYSFIYNAFFHPLAKFPGPKLYGASQLPIVLSTLRGRYAYTVKDLHTRYGTVVRIAPDELAFSSAAASKDIYTRRGTRPPLQKHPITYTAPEGGVHSILTVKNNDDHSRYRRLLNHAFSEKALQEQAPHIKQYIDLLIQRLHENAGKGSQDMVKWYNFVTFDIIGDLTLGESFDCLQQSELHQWVSFLFASFKYAAIFAALRRFAMLTPLLKAVLPKKLLEAKVKHFAFTKEKVEKRMELGTERPDFMSRVLRHNDKETGMTKEEIIPTFAIILLAGSETTATTLSATTFLLLKHPEVMRKLVDEIRSSFRSEDEITHLSVNKLKYQAAVIEEALRMHAPTPNGPPRVVDGQGDTIDGHWVPAGTSVSVSTYSTNRQSANFRDADSFAPERWLDDQRYAADNKAAFQPFSLGPRNCIGRNLANTEIRLILARVLWNFDLELEEKSRRWIDHMRMYFLWERPPLFLKLSPFVEEKKNVVW